MPDINNVFFWGKQEERTPTELLFLKSTESLYNENHETKKATKKMSKITHKLLVIVETKELI